MRPQPFLLPLFVFLVLLARSANAAPVTIFSEGFETQPITDRWTLIDPLNPEEPDPETRWGIVNSSFGLEGTHSGSFKAYCAGRGHLGSVIDPHYPIDFITQMKRDAIDLRGFTNVMLSFWYKVKIPDTDELFALYQDYMSIYVDDETFALFDTMSLEHRLTNWTQVTLPLADYAGEVRSLTFEFLSDASNDVTEEPDPEVITVTTTDYEGIYLDDITITGEPLIKFSSITATPTEVRLNVTGASAGVSYTIQTSPGLIGWSPLTNVLATGGTFQVTDIPGSGTRFYRIAIE